MPEVTCISGPDFIISGGSLYFNEQPSFEIVFDNPADEPTILRYEWYLNGEVVISADAQEFHEDVPYGSHKIGARVLTAGGWSGMRYFNFQSYGDASSMQITGPATVKEGASAEYHVIAAYPDNVTFDFTSDFTFNCPDGTFDGNIFTAAVNNVPNDTRQTLITATKIGGSKQVVRQITILDGTAPEIVSLTINGPSVVEEGRQYLYRLIAAYNNGVSVNVTGQAKFTLGATGRGEFHNTAQGANLNVHYNIFTDDTVNTTVNAEYQGLSVQQNITIVDTTATTVTFAITGPASVAEGSGAAYNVMAHFASGQEKQVTEHYTFSCPEGTFNGNYFTAFTNSISNDNRQAVITASGTNVPEVNRQITITDTTAPRWGNIIQSAVFVRDNCGEGYTGSSVVYTIKANTYYSAVSQEDANNIALNDILDNGQNYANTNGSCLAVADSIQINNFDHLLLRFHWQADNGRDLDILLGYENNGSVFDSRYVGYGGVGETLPAGITPKSNAYLWWGQDNRGDAGTEGVVVGLKKLAAAQPGLPAVIEAGLYAVWYGLPVTGNFTLEINAYQGGTMQLSGTSFINTGGTEVAAHTVIRNTMLRKAGNTPATYYKTGTLKYNRLTQTAVLYL